ncbi:unnamed protein product [Larinioides sclopetarius]|uniref:Uncharacterized protein n=1 Tax=Larinioides sclopetarius TaxID=280406 RepID=A0AAV2B254_9ARAC
MTEEINRREDFETDDLVHPVKFIRPEFKNVFFNWPTLEEVISSNARDPPVQYLCKLITCGSGRSSTVEDHHIQSVVSLPSVIPSLQQKILEAESKTRVSRPDGMDRAFAPVRGPDVKSPII